MQQKFLPTLDENEIFSSPSEARAAAGRSVPPPPVTSTSDKSVNKRNTSHTADIFLDNDPEDVREDEKQQLITAKMAVDLFNPKLIKKRKTKSLFCFKLITILGLCWMIGGGYFISSYVKIVKKQQIGYYTNTDSEKIYQPGIYFEIPWSNSRFVTVNKFKDRFDVKKVTGKTKDNMYYFIEYIQIYYNVTRLQLYIQKIKQENGLKKFKKYLAILISNNIETVFKNRLSTDEIDIESLELLPSNQFGISINRVVSTHILKTTNIDYLQRIMDIEQLLIDFHNDTIEGFVDLEHNETIETTEKIIETTEKVIETTQDINETTQNPLRAVEDRDIEETTEEIIPIEVIETTEKINETTLLDIDNSTLRPRVKSYFDQIVDYY